MATDRANHTPEELHAICDAALPIQIDLTVAVRIADAVLPGHDRRLLLALANEIELNDYWEIEQAVGHIRFRAATPTPPVEQPPTQEIIETDRWGL